MSSRKLYRNVDGRIVIMFLPLKWNFIRFLFTSVLFLVLIFGLYYIISNNENIDNSVSVESDIVDKNKSNDYFGVLFISFLFISGNYYLNAEFKFRESGLDFIKNKFRYLREGKLVYERSCSHVRLLERFIWNKIKKQFKY